MGDILSYSLSLGVAGAVGVGVSVRGDDRRCGGIDCILPVSGGEIEILR